MKSLTVEDLKARLDAGDTPLVVDVRERWEYDICHIEGSLNIPLSEFERRSAELAGAGDIVMICHHGGRSFQAACYLESLYTECDPANLEGGIDAWARRIEPGMPVY